MTANLWEFFHHGVCALKHAFVSPETRYSRQYCGYPGRETRAIAWAILAIAVLLLVFACAFGTLTHGIDPNDDDPSEIQSLNGTQILTMIASLLIFVCGIVHFQVFYAGYIPGMRRSRFAKYQIKAPVSEMFLTVSLAYGAVAIIVFPSSRLAGADAVGRASPLAPIAVLTVLLSWYIFQLMKINVNQQRWTTTGTPTTRPPAAPTGTTGTTGTTTPRLRRR